jgi:colanic acid/amylovoran biosynthesis glycosyltransferase
MSDRNGDAYTKVKIAYLVNQYPQASQSFIRREINALEKLGVEVERYTLRTWDQELVDAGDKAEKEKAKVVLGVGAFGLLRATLSIFFTRPGRFCKTLALTWKMGKKGDRGRLYQLIYLAEACVLLRWLSQSGAIHVHAHFGTNSTGVAMLVRELGGPTYSFTCHGPEEFDRPLALKLGEKIARAEFVVAVSDYGRSQLYRWCEHIHWHKIHVVHCGVDASFLSDGWAELSDTSRLVCVGRLCEQKGQLLLVQAAAILKQESVPFKLVLVGDGPMRKEVESVIGRCGLSDQVSITGWMTNQQVQEQILESRAMILPSFAEGLPVVVMEALALKRPVLSTYVAGIPELVEPGICGYLVPAGSVERLADGMKQVLTDPISRLREMGKAGARQVALRHDARFESAKLLDLFRAIAGSPDATSNVACELIQPSSSERTEDRSEVKVG